VKNTETSTPGTPPKAHGVLSLQNRLSPVRKGFDLISFRVARRSGSYFLFNEHTNHSVTLQRV